MFNRSVRCVLTCVLGERIDERVAGRLDRVRRVDEDLARLTDAATQPHSRRPAVGRPDTAGELRCQRQAVAVVHGALRIAARCPGIRSWRDLPAIGDAAEGAEGHALHQLAVILVEERRDGRRIHGEDDVLVLRPEHRAVQREPAVGEVPLACRPRSSSDYCGSTLGLFELFGCALSAKFASAGWRHRRAVRDVDVASRRRCDTAHRGLAADQRVGSPRDRR